MILMKILLRRNKKEAGAELERIHRKRVTSTIRLYRRVTITTKICKRITFATEKSTTRENLQSIDSKQTPRVHNFNKQQKSNICNSISHDLHDYNLRKRRELECKECNFRCVECKTNANYSLLPK